MAITVLTQAQVQPSVSDLRPALYTAGGALLGVLLTLVTQGLNGRLQRHHENQGRAFEARFQIYSQFLEDVYRLRIMIDETRTTLSDPLMYSALRATDVTLPEPDLSIQWVLDLPPIAEYPEFSSLSRAVQEDVLGRLQDAVKKHREHAELANRLMENLTTIAVQSQLLGDRRLYKALGALFRGIQHPDGPRVRDLLAFRSAVRAELGIGSRGLAGWINDVRLRRSGHFDYTILVDKRA